MEDKKKTINVVARELDQGMTTLERMKIERSALVKIYVASLIYVVGMLLMSVFL